MIKNNQQKIVDAFVEAVGELGASFGISRVVAQIYGLLYLSEEPLSLDDICAALKISKGSASVNIRYLENWQAVKRLWIKGERKDYYQANPDIKEIVYRRLKEGLERRFNKFNQQLTAIEKEIREKNGYREKIGEVRKLLKMLDKIRFLGKAIFGE